MVESGDALRRLAAMMHLNERASRKVRKVRKGN